MNEPVTYGELFIMISVVIVTCVITFKIAERKARKDYEKRNNP